MNACVFPGRTISCDGRGGLRMNHVHHRRGGLVGCARQLFARCRARSGCRCGFRNPDAPAAASTKSAGPSHATESHAGRDLSGCGFLISLTVIICSDRVASRSTASESSRCANECTMLNTAGTKTSVATVAHNSPPITARPSGAFCSPPSPRPERHRNHADDHGQRRHQHRPEARVTRFNGGLASRRRDAPGAPWRTQPPECCWPSPRPCT